MRNTTTGLGPFRPAIQFEGEVWELQNQTYKNEDKAAAHALKNIKALRAMVARTLIEAGYRKKDKP